MAAGEVLDIDLEWEEGERRIESLLSAQEKHYKHRTARIDIKNLSGDENVMNDIVFDQVPDHAVINKASWDQAYGTRYTIESQHGSLTMQCHCIENGTLQIDLLGICERRGDGSCYPWWICYESMTVNEKEIFTGPLYAWHNKRAQFFFDTNVYGKDFKIEIAWKSAEEGIDALLREKEAMQKELESIRSAAGSRGGNYKGAFMRKRRSSAGKQ